MNKVQKSVVLGLGTVFALSASFIPAKAATTTVTSNTIPLTSTGSYPQSLLLPDFDSSLGTLTGINLTLYGNFNASAGVFNFSGGTATVTALAASSNITLNGPASISLAVNSSEVVSSITSLTPLIVANGGSPSYTGLTGSASGSATPTDYADYTGSSTSNITMSVTASSSASGTGSTSGASPFLFGYTGSGSAGGYATAVYTYTPSVTATPEPGSVAMLSGMGITGSLLMVRRRRARK